jgi:hypothetical protein
MDDLTHKLALFDPIDAQVRQFQPITLDEMAQVTLLDRVDTKYALTLSQLRDTLASLAEDYRALRIHQTCMNHYHTVYFDTPDFSFYQQHHNGWSNRYKVRAREYVDSNLVFFEVKHRTNRNRTIKSRLSVQDVETDIRGSAASFLDAHTPFHAENLEPKLWNDYLRITLVGRQHAERVTLDLNVGFGWGAESVTLSGLVIAEVKQKRLSRLSPFIQQMRQRGIRPISLSKYCTGVYSLYNGVKSNNFKAQMRFLSKFIEEDSHGSLA